MLKVIARGARWATWARKVLTGRYTAPDMREVCRKSAVPVMLAGFVGLFFSPELGWVTAIGVLMMVVAGAVMFDNGFRRRK